MLNAFGLMLTGLFYATVGIVFVTALPLVIAYLMGLRLPVLPFVALSGALGAFVSSLSRIYGLKDLPALLLINEFRLIRNRYILMYSLIPPLIGVVAAVLVYVAIAAQLVEGNLFPAFQCFDEGYKVCDKGIDGLLKYGPQSAVDCAKSLFWSFVAGFSERFFPGIVEGLTKQK